MEDKLKYVHPDLCSLWINFRDELRKRDVGFEPVLMETLRTPERQAALFRSGASRTLRSRHLLHNGFVHAIDIGADVRVGDGVEVRWDWPLYYRMANVMRDVSRALGIPVTWGGIWDTPLGRTQGPIELCVEEYQARHRKRWMATAKPGERYPGAFADGPHYELPWVDYP